MIFLGGIIALALGVAYILVISILVNAWHKLPVWKLPDDFVPSTRLTVLVPARNEAKNIEKCLRSITAQNYPRALYEVFVIDDFSNDETPELVEKFVKSPVRLLKLSDYFSESEIGNAFKKRALEIGIRNAKGDLIITTDADCIVQENWLRSIAAFYQTKGYSFIAAPVNFYAEVNLFEKFQSLDLLGMMLITGAGIHGRFLRMGNGANLAYSKEFFAEIGGFDNIDHLASGDDVLLIQKAAEKAPHRIGFLKSTAATVFTKAKPDLQSFVAQRIRWATKSNAYREKATVAVLAVVFLFCLAIVIGLLLIPFWGMPALIIFLALLSVKLLADYWMLSIITQFFNKGELMRSFFPAQLLHILYIVYFGFIGNLKRKYSWKGRIVE